MRDALLKVPPEYTPPMASVVGAPEAPREAGNVTTAVTEPPGGMAPTNCGIGVPMVVAM
jgi:hypothetical protein